MSRLVLSSVLLASVGCAGSAAAQRQPSKPAVAADARANAAARAEPANSASSQPPARRGGDPFARLRVRIPRDQLRPLKSVRIRDQRERPQGRITVTIKTSPAGAKVTYGGKNLGLTPIKLQADANSTPLDIVIRKAGYMLLRTRVQRRVTRTYHFKLTPAKLE